MFEYGYNLSQQSVPSGQVTFVIRNNGSEVHNFTVQGVKVGALLNPGQTETYTVGLPAQRFSYVCDVPFHIDRGMLGSSDRQPLMPAGGSRPPRRLPPAARLRWPI